METAIIQCGIAFYILHFTFYICICIFVRMRAYEYNATTRRIVEVWNYGIAGLFIGEWTQDREHKYKYRRYLKFVICEHMWPLRFVNNIHVIPRASCKTFTHLAGRRAFTQLPLAHKDDT